MRPRLKAAPLFFLFLLIVILVTACTFPNGDPVNKYAIVYGVSVYISAYPEGSYPNLAYPNDDAQEVASLLLSKGYQVTARYDSDATIDALRQDAAAIGAAAGENDIFIFYFAGHGVQSGNFSQFPETVSEPPSGDLYDEWIMLYGSVGLDATDITINPDYAVSDNNLTTILSPISARKKIILLDACNSGGFIGESADVDGIPQSLLNGDITKWILSKSFSLYFSYPGNNADVPANQAIVLSAAGEQEYSWESGLLGHGIFTYYFLKSPAEGDLNGDGFVTINESYSYISKKIVEEWNGDLSSSMWFHPHISGGPLDYVLFESGS